MTVRSQPYRVEYPLDAIQAANIDEMFQILFDDLRNGNLIITLPDQVTGVLNVPHGGTGKASWAIGDLVYAPTTTTLAGLTIGSAGTIVRSTGTLPAYTAFTVPNTFAQGDVIYGSATNVLTALAKDTNATRYLSNTGASNNPAWAQVSLTTGVSGTLPTGSGGTGTATTFTQGSVVFAGASGIYTQNNAKFFWDNTSFFHGIGTAGPQAPIHISTDGVTIGSGLIAAQDKFIISSSDAADARWTFLAATGGSGGRPVIKFIKARGTIGAFAAVGATDTISSILSTGYDGSGFVITAGIEFNTDAAVSAGVVPQNLQLLTGTTTRIERLLITSAGKIGINQSSPQAKLHLSRTNAVINSNLLLGNETLLIDQDTANTNNSLTIVNGPGTGVAAPNRSVVNLVRTRGTPDTPTTIASGDAIGAIVAYGYDGTAIRGRANIAWLVDGVVSASNVPTAVILQTGVSGATERFRITSGGLAGFGDYSGGDPTAVLHLKAGTATASTAPLKFTSGTSLTTAEAGAMEFTTDDFFLTITTGAARKGIILDNGSRLTSGKIPVATTNGRLIDLTASSAYTPTNVTTDRSYDANATSIDELADVIGTIIADLQTKGILG